MWQSIPGMFKLSVIAYSVVPSKNVFVKEDIGNLTDFFAKENSGKTTFSRYEKKLLTSCFFFLCPTFGLENRGLSTSGKEKRGDLNGGAGPGLHTGPERWASPGGTF